MRYLEPGDRSHTTSNGFIIGVAIFSLFMSWAIVSAQDEVDIPPPPPPLAFEGDCCRLTIGGTIECGCPERWQLEGGAGTGGGGGGGPYLVGPGGAGGGGGGGPYHQVGFDCEQVGDRIYCIPILERAQNGERS